MATLLRTSGENFCVTMFVLAIVVATANTLARRGTPQGNFSEQFLRWFSFFAIGITGLYTFAGHVFAPQESARLIGWEDSPFQLEVGTASLGFGLVGLLAFRKDYGLRLAAIVGPACFMWGAAAAHIYQMITQHNFAPGNAGVMFWMGVLLPPYGLVLFDQWRRTQSSQQRTQQADHMETAQNWAWPRR